MAVESSELFERVVALCGLSDVFAADSVERACARAGVQGRQLTPAGLQKTLPELAKVLRVFLGKDESARRVALISALVPPTVSTSGSDAR